MIGGRDHRHSGQDPPMTEPTRSDYDSPWKQALERSFPVRRSSWQRGPVGLKSDRHGDRPEGGPPTTFLAHP